MRKMLASLVLLGFVLAACSNSGGSDPVEDVDTGQPAGDVDVTVDAADVVPDVPGPDVIDIVDVPGPKDEESGDDIVDIVDTVDADPDGLDAVDAADSIEDTDVFVCVENADCDTPADLCQVAVCNDGVCGVEDKDCTPDGADPADIWSCVPATGACIVCVGCNIGQGHPCINDPDYCDDGEICTTDTCDAQFGCSHTGNTLDCDDDNPCTEQDICQPDPWGNFEAICKGTPISCDDGDDCTHDYCLSTTGCRHFPLEEPCDALPCPSGQDSDCPDTGDPCSEYQCAAGANVCVLTRLTGACDDGSLCTEDGQCVDGLCEPGETISCDDGDACTADTCVPATGCVNTAMDPCPYPCASEQDCLDHYGTGTLSNPCREWHCTARADQDGYCVLLEPDIACDDGNACTLNDRCIDGVCGGTSTADCGDGDPCTIDDCLPEEGCVHDPIGLECYAQQCVSGVDCLGLNPALDADRCVVPSCFVYPGGSSLCFYAELLDCRCDGAGDDAVCDDGITCTIDQCVPNDSDVQPQPSYYCSHAYDITSCCEEPCTTSAACDDGNKCTQDYCNIPDGSSTGCCVHPYEEAPCGLPCDGVEDCATENSATESECNVDDGTCDPTRLIDCGEFDCETNEDCATNAAFSDRNPCTDEVCVGCTCQHVPNQRVCNDYDRCTTGDVCSEGVCAGTEIDCGEAENPNCYTMECDADEGCIPVWDPVPGSCSLVCEQDPSICDDDNPCTMDTCADDGGCLNVNMNDQSDHLVCVRYACDSDINCDDGNPCTADVCVGGGDVLPVEERSCQYTVVPSCTPPDDLADCEDPIDCQSPVACVADSGEACCVSDTLGLRAPPRCEPLVGCRWVPIEDCTGACSIPDQAVDCNDRNACTVDVCDPETLTCDNSLAAWMPSENLLSECYTCDDENSCDFLVSFLPPCTLLRCEPTSNPTPEGNSGQGFCMAYVDELVHPAGCDDYNVCTDDVCTPTGCEHSPSEGSCHECWAPGDCADGDPCTLDICEMEQGGCSHEDAATCFTPECTSDDDCLTEGCEATECVGGYCRPFVPDVLQEVCAETGCTNEVDCDDADPTTLDLCLVSKGLCLWIEVGADQCTVADDCHEGLDDYPCVEVTGCVDGLCTWRRDPACEVPLCDAATQCEGSPCAIQTCVGGPGGNACMVWGGEDERCCASSADCALSPDDTTGLTPAASPFCGESNRCESIGYPQDILTGGSCETAADCLGNCPAEEYPEASAISFEIAPLASCLDWPCAEPLCTAQGRCIYRLDNCGTCDNNLRCLDDNPCTTDWCDDGTCRHTAISNCTVTACSADNPCVSDEPCTMGICVPSIGCLWVPIDGCE